MRISDNILKEILNQMPVNPPEEGGIIGGTEGRVCIWRHDRGYPERGGAYRPNVEYLNKVIAEWMDSGFVFMGIFHVHFGGSKALSDSDRGYIKRIMGVMPESIEKLYFPLVVQPERQWVSYVAYRNSKEKITVAKDEVEVLYQGGEEVK